MLSGEKDTNLGRKWVLSLATGMLVVVMALAAGGSPSLPVYGELSTAALSDIAVVAGGHGFVVVGRVTHVESGLLNTPNGIWDSDAISGSVHDAFAQLYPVQHVTVVVEEILGGLPPSEILLVVPGGMASFVLTEEEANAIGITVQPPEPVGSLDGIPPPPGLPVVGDLPVTRWTNRPLVELGSRVMFAARSDGMLSDGTLQYVAGTWDGGALFIATADTWLHFATGGVTGDREARDLVIALGS